MMKQTPKKSGLFCRFIKQTKGNAGLIFAGIAIPLFAMVGLGVDGSRAALAKYELQAALDSGLLALASTKDNTINLEERLETFTRRNFTYVGASEPIVTIQDSDEEARIAFASTTVTNFFMGIIGQPQSNVRVSSKVSHSSGAVMVAMVLDNTGSLWTDNKFAGLKEAAHLFIDQMFDVQTRGKAPAKASKSTYISIVPYGTAINVGEEANKGAILDPALDHSSYTAHLSFPSDTTKPYDASLIGENTEFVSNDTKWMGCLFARMGQSSVAGQTHRPAALTDTTVEQDGYWKPFESRHFWDNDFYSRYWNRYYIQYTEERYKQTLSPNRGCGQPIVPLTNDYNKLNSAINVMTAWDYGGTLSDIGLAWGRRVLSPEPPFSESNTPIAQGRPIMAEDPAMEKIIIIMTDSDNGYRWTDDVAYGYERSSMMQSYLGWWGSLNWSTFGRTINSRTVNLCNDIKQQDIVIYTIIFGTSASSRGKSTFRNCATDPQTHYFEAPNSQTLKNVFQAIGRDLSRISVRG